MNEQNMERIMYIYANSTPDRKKQDLSRFMDKEDAPHHSSAPMKRRLITIGLCVLVIAAVCGIFALSQQPYPPLWDVQYTEFNNFHTGIFGAAPEDTQTMAECVGSQFPVPDMLPTVQCSDISVCWIHRMDDKKHPVGVYGSLKPAGTDVTAVDVVYLYSSVADNEEIVTEMGFRNLPHTVNWQNLSITYSDAADTEDGTVYKLCFEYEGFFCCLDVYAPANSQITDLLTAVFG